MNRDHDSELFLLALSRIEREAANRLGVPLALGPRMAAAIKAHSPEQKGPEVGLLVGYRSV